MQNYILYIRYGYYEDHHEDNYYFSKPKYQIYPYSQEDIPPANPLQHHQYQQQQQQQHYEPIDSGYYSQPQRLHTTVEIQPSHSYEIKEVEQGYKTILEPENQNHAHPHGNYQNEEQQLTGPVIVLRIPGPQKYALHLQALLQQYLEVRAAQYIQVLQEQEAQSQANQQYSQNNHQYNTNSDNFALQGYSAPVLQVEQHHQSSHFDQNLNYETQPHEDQVQISLKEQTNIQVQQEPDGYQQQLRNPVEISQDYQDDYQPAYENQEHQAHQQQQPKYVYGPPQSESVSLKPNLLTTENFPSPKHTQVIFRSTTAEPIAHQNDHNVEQYRAPLVYHQLQQFYGNEQEYPSSVSHDYSNQHSESASETNFVTITPRSLPYNYHAHPQPSEHPRTANPSAIRSSKRHAQFSAEQLKKFTKLMNQMKNKSS